jgi:type II secretory pathway pseudopilin PulG
VRLVRDESGETLVESLAAITILGIVVTALLFGIGSAARMSGQAESDAKALVVLSRAAEVVKDVDGVTCTTLSPSTFTTPLAAMQDLPAGWSTANVSVTAAACTTSATGGRLARVTLQASAPNGGATHSLVVAPRVVS